MEFFPDLYIGTVSANVQTKFKTAYVQVKNKGTYWSKACTLRVTVAGHTTFVNVPAIPQGGSHTVAVPVPVSLHGRTVSVYVDVYHVNTEDPNWANNAKSTFIP